MERAIALLVLCACAGAVAAAAVADSEVPIHYVEQPRFAQSQAHAQADADADAEDAEEAEGPAEDALTEGVTPAVEVPWKPADAFTREVAATSEALGKAESEELARTDSVMAESSNTMTQSAKCLMYCANGYGLCTRSNEGGCACAAGCMCNRGEAGASCAEHCHPDNQMNFVYGYHDANHFSPHLWGKSIGDVLTHYGQVRACLAGCAKRGKCAPRFCPRHPSGGYKCSACKRLEVIPRPKVRGEKNQRYFTAPRPSRSGRRGFGGRRHTVTVQHTHNGVDEWGHLVRHTHSRTTHHTHYPALAETDATAHADAEAETETEAEAEAEADAEAESEAEAEAESSESMAVTMESSAEADAMVEADVEAAAQAEADAGYVSVTETPYSTVVTSSGSNIRRYAPRVVPEQFAAPFPGDDHADNGIVDAHVPQDPLAKRIDCNFYDCTGMQSEPYVPVGSMNPVIPYRYTPDTRTTTFGTVPDMLEPRAEQKLVVMA